MLYQAFESQRTLMEPFIDFAQAAAKLYSNPMSPASQNPFAQRVAAAYSLIYRLGKDYEKPRFDIQTVDVKGVSIAIHERIEIDKPFCELRRFKRFSDDPATLTQLKDQPAVLIVAPLSGHYATLLRDTVKTALKDHKVYITDWKNARTVPLTDGEFHLDDYVNYVQEFIRHLQGKYGNCHVISVCQPTVPVFAAISLMASRGETTPLSMVMMGGPIDARLCATAVNDLATTKPYEWFENNVIYRVPGNFPGAGRRVYPGFLQYTGFVAMNPDRHASSHFDYFKDLLKGDDASAEAHRKFYDEYNAVLDMDANYYLETIKTVFQDFSLVKGTWDVKSVTGELERVRPGDITTTAVLTVEGELDDISGAGQTRAALDMCSGVPEAKKEHYEAMGAGHYGIFSGRRWREHVYPAMKAFILANHQPAGLANATQAASKSVAKPKSATLQLAAPARATSSRSAKAPAKSNGAAGAAKVAKTVNKPAAAPAAKPAAAKAAAKATAPVKAKTAAKAPAKAAVRAAAPTPAKKASPAAPAKKVANSAVKPSAPAAFLAKTSKASATPKPSKAAKAAPSSAASAPAAAAKTVAVAPKVQPAKVSPVSKPAAVTPAAAVAQPTVAAVQAANVAPATATPSSTAAAQSPAA